ncbi:hypothetical protein V6X42_18765 [Serratia marcescens]|uniref:hypothetical protein n=1 Tax=Serratia marcescens TaxID=615 RepID=UPI0018D90112|nr:hypothetical protein [Serratia marcescens]HEJ7928012.1 hypothetical protein [Serratia marcescens]
MNEKLCSDDVKIIKHQIIFKKSQIEIVDFMVRQFGLEKTEAESVYEQLVTEVHRDQKNIRYGDL